MSDIKSLTELLKERLGDVFDCDFSTVGPLEYRNLLDLMSRASLVFALRGYVELYQRGDGSFFVAMPMSPWDAGTYALLAVPRTMAVALAAGKITPADHDAIFGS
ncbi:MAG: hypothetical protein EOM03_19365 [Clostridia bacterium]|nr:hypothetical protein [Clostridia bacterium]